MRKKGLLAIVMTVVMLMPMLMSCSSEKKDRKTVKEDDPWYETTRFELKNDVREFETLGYPVVSASDDSIFALYALMGGLGATSRAVLDEYDFEGNLVKRMNVANPDGFRLQDFQALRAEPDGKTIEAVAFLNSSEKHGHAFVSIDTETGKVSNVKMLERNGKYAGMSIGAPGASFIGDYAVAVLDDFSGDMMSASYAVLLYKDSEPAGEFDLSFEKILIPPSSSILSIVG